MVKTYRTHEQSQQKCTSCRKAFLPDDVRVEGGNHLATALSEHKMYHATCYNNLTHKTSTKKRATHAQTSPRSSVGSSEPRRRKRTDESGNSPTEEEPTETVSSMLSSIPDLLHTTSSVASAFTKHLPSLPSSNAGTEKTEEDPSTTQRSDDDERSSEEDSRNEGEAMEDVQEQGPSSTNSESAGTMIPAALAQPLQTVQNAVNEATTAIASKGKQLADVARNNVPEVVAAAPTKLVEAVTHSFPEAEDPTGIEAFQEQQQQQQQEQEETTKSSSDAVPEQNPSEEQPQIPQRRSGGKRQSGGARSPSTLGESGRQPMMATRGQQPRAQVA